MLIDPAAPPAHRQLAAMSMWVLTSRPLLALWTLRWPVAAGVFTGSVGWTLWGPSAVLVALMIAGLCSVCLTVFSRSRFARELVLLVDLRSAVSSSEDREVLVRLVRATAGLEDAVAATEQVREMALELDPRRGAEVARTYEMLLWEGSERLFDLARMWPATPQVGDGSPLSDALDDLERALEVAAGLRDALSGAWWGRSSRLPGMTTAKARSMADEFRALC